MSIQKAKSSVHVTIATTPLLSSGGARSSPPKGGTAYRGTVAPSTGYPIFLQLSMPPLEFAVAAAPGRLVRPLSKGHISRSDRPFPRLAGPDAPACAPPAPALPFAVSLTCARPRFCRGPPSVPKPRGKTKFGEGNQPVCVRFISHIICIIKSGTRIWPLTFFFCRL